jgi:hypothetical protein
MPAMLFQHLKARLLPFLDAPIDTTNASPSKLGTVAPHSPTLSPTITELVLQSLYLIGLALTTKSVERDQVHATIRKLESFCASIVIKQQYGLCS